MSLFDRIFGAKKERELTPDSFFQTLNAYVPAFTNWNGSIYESELVRSAINAKAEHVSKMSVKVMGAAKPALQTKLKCAPNEFQTWSQFLYRLSTILDVNNTAFIVPVVDRYGDTTGIYPVLPTLCDIVEYKGTPYLRYQFASGNVASIELENCGIMTKFQYHNDFLGDPNNANGKNFYRKHGGELVEFPIMHPFGDKASYRGIGVADMAWAIRTNRPHRLSAEMGFHALEVVRGILDSGHDGQFRTFDTQFERPVPIPIEHMGGTSDERNLFLYE